MPCVVRWLHELASVAPDGPSYPASALSPPSAWQRGCPEVIPGLQAAPVWAPCGPPCPFVETVCGLLKAAYPAIRKEVLALRGVAGFHEYRAPTAAALVSTGTSAGTAATPSAVAGSRRGTDAGLWSVYYLQLHNTAYEDNLARCPATAALLASIPRGYGHAMFSALAPGTHIPTHTGATNKKIRFHLPLAVPPGDGARLRVGPTTHVLAEGEPFAFDDSFQHEAWNDASDAARIVLIVDCWHPGLTDEEVKFLHFVRSAEMRAAKAASDAGKMAAADDFYAVLAAARQAPCDDGVVFRGIGDGGDRTAASGAGSASDAAAAAADAAPSGGADGVLSPLAAAHVRDD